MDKIEVILFGSYATGTNRENSDIDVAVVVEKLE
jgi:predicted nucleotidyltransferase